MEARYAVEAVETLRLKVSTIDSLNDPYEVNPSFIVSENIGKEADSKLFAETYREMLCQNYGFICFSATCDDPVLWAHYGDKNRGIALEFNWPLHDRWLKEVDYTDDRPSINIQSMNDNNNVHNFEQA